jgi:glycosyltransferase involved in cell wall biosynthesis
MKELGPRFTLDALVSHPKCRELQRAANVTLCYSVEEALPLFVYEGMAFGHVLIRNDSSGSREQIIDGKNGLKVTSNDYAGLVDAIERIANKSKTSNATLTNMSRMSNQIALKATMNRYTFETEMLKDFEALNPTRQG